MLGHGIERATSLTDSSQQQALSALLRLLLPLKSVIGKEMWNKNTALKTCSQLTINRNFQ
jgi:hypothetical protein